MHLAWLGCLKKCCILHKFKKKYLILNNIGKGSRSVIKQVSSLENNKIYAVKDFSKEEISSSQDNDKEKIIKIFQNVENEINISRLISHENTMRFYEVYESKRHIRLVFENLSGGDLLKKLTNPNFKHFKEKELKFIIKQILTALNYLHEKEIMHRDIKPENILFETSKNLILKVGDFGFCEFAKTKKLICCQNAEPRDIWLPRYCLIKNMIKNAICLEWE